MKLFKSAAVAAVLVLAGCASGGRCVGEFEYQQAQTQPPVQGADGVKAPESVSALRIPPPPKRNVAYAEHVPNPDKPGKQKVMCLDTPPVMAEPVAPAPAVTPAPAPAAVPQAPPPAAAEPAPAS